MTIEAHRLLPNLLVPGVTKAGTTSLFHYLGQHPAIFPAAEKESNVLAALRYRDDPGCDPVAEYARYFHDAGPQQWRLDVSPTYLSAGPRLVRAVHDLMPVDARVLVTVREPVGRLFSAFRMKAAKDVLDDGADLAAFVDRAIALDASGEIALEEHAVFRTLAMARYADHLADWIEVFGTERVGVVAFESLAESTRQTVMAIVMWLGLDTGMVAEMDLGVRNQTVQPRSQSVRRLAQRANKAASGVLDRAPALRERLRGAYAQINASDDAPTFDPEVRARLVAWYAPHVAAAADLIDDDLLVGPRPSWLDPS